jgi:hypothetical protein
MKPLLTLLSALTLVLSGVAQTSCESALAVGLGQHSVPGVTGETGGVSCNFNELTGNAMWYTFTPESDMGVEISSAIEPYTDTRLFLFSGDCDNLICVGGNDDGGPGYSSILTANLDANITYYIVWDAYWGNAPFSFSVSEVVIPPTLLNFTFLPINGGGTISGADINGDKLDDLLVLNGSALSVRLQQTDGTFEALEIPFNSLQNTPDWSLAAGDMNNDGWTDIVSGGGSGVSLLLSQNNGASYEEFTVSDYVFSQRTNCIDLNNDGLLDAFICHDVAPNVGFINNGDGTFDFFQGGMGDTPDGGNYGSVWVDYDNDCDMDLFIAKCRGGLSEASRNQMHRNNGDGTFTEVSDEAGLSDYVQTWSSAWADYDNDGDMDAVIGASSFTTGIHRVMRNNGDGTFTDIATGSGFDTFNGLGIDWAPADFNNDGYVDVIGGGQFIAVNNGDFTFTISTVPAYPGPLGDFNNDGFIDIANGAGAFINDGNDNNYVKVALQGTSSNLQGIGARVTVHTPDGNQIRDIRSGEGFRYMGSLNAHFGLGETTEITKISVCWPSGVEDEIFNPDINTLHVITEGPQVSVNEQVMPALTIYPNPARETILLNGADELIDGVVMIFDATGRMVHTAPLRTAQVDISMIRSGVYTVRLEKGDVRVSTRLIKE